MCDSFDSKSSPEATSDETWEKNCEIMMRKKGFWGLCFKWCNLERTIKRSSSEGK